MNNKQIQTIAAMLCGYHGRKNIDIKKDYEKIRGQRKFSLRDIKAMADGIPPELRGMRADFISALFGWEMIDVSRIGGDCGTFSSTTPSQSPPSLPEGWEIIEGGQSQTKRAA